MNRNKVFNILLSLILPTLILSIKPLGMSLNQTIVISSLILVLIWWTTNIVNRSFASVFLLFVFLLFGNTPPKVIFRFALSTDFYLIILSFLLSQGIVNSNIASRFSEFFLTKYGNTGIKLVGMSFVLGFILMFIIPQPFSRVILLASIYNKFLESKDISNKTRQVLLYSVFVASTAVSMFMLNGDIILNYSIFEITNISISAGEWMKYMSLPTIFAVALIYISYIFTWRKELKNVNLTENKVGDIEKPIKNEKLVTLLILLIAFMWMTEGLHGINSALVALIGTLVMFGFKIISKRDLKSINISLMIFLIAAFSIGGVMSISGVADKLYSELLNIIRFSDNYNIFLFSIIGLIMFLHMFLGSSVTTISVVTPGLIELTKGKVQLTALLFLIYISVNIHYVLPFHQATVMVGAGKHYDGKIVFKFGLTLTIIVLIALFCFYIPWWDFLGVLNYQDLY